MDRKTPSKRHVTRQSHCCPLFGMPQELSQASLPTYAEVLLCCLNESYKLSASSDSKKKIAFSSISDAVATKVEELYQKSSIPIVSHTRVVKMIKVYHDAYYNFKKSYVRDKEKINYKAKVETFVNDGNSKLFDIAACKCKMTFTCTCGKRPGTCSCCVVMECHCEKDNKVPAIERKFLHDQRTTRQRAIGSVDKKETERLQKRAERKNLEASKIANPNDCEHSEESTSSRKVKFRNQRTPTEDHVFPSTSQMRISLFATALMSDRYGVPDRATAAIASSVLQDVGLVTERDKSLVVDKNKVRREKHKARSSVKSTHPITFEGLYFDGRKDRTITQEKIGDKKYRREVKEEHISLLQEPGSKYIGHITPSSGSGRNISDSMFHYFAEKQYDLTELIAVGCDGTATNTGWRNGVIRNIELKLQRPLQWFICLLHFNELPFRHLFEHLDGDTSGPKSFTGEIGKRLNGCETLHVVKFEAIPSEIIDATRSNLSTDQKYLLDVVEAVRTGECPRELAAREPGTLNHSRWLTCANRVLRLYVSQIQPSNNLKVLATYIVKTYAPVWFDVKRFHSVKYGPKHVFKTIQTSKHLPEELLGVIKPVIQRNAFFAHPENMLLAMTMDEREKIRELAFRRLLKARSVPVKGKSVRTFQVPTLNFNATDYTELINWDSCELSPPPMMRKLSNRSLHALLQTKVVPQFEFVNFPCHTQSVERCVKLVTGSAVKVCGSENRDGYIRTTLLSRSVMPEFGHKSDYKTIPTTQK